MSTQVNWIFSDTFRLYKNDMIQYWGTYIKVYLDTEKEEKIKHGRIEFFFNSPARQIRKTCLPFDAGRVYV